MKKIIFDLDFTVLFLDSSWPEYYQKFISKYNLDIDAKTLFKTIGLYEKEGKNLICKEEDLINFVNEKLNINITLNMFYDFCDIYASIPLINIDSIKKTLEYLSKKYELIAYTNWFKDNQIERLKRYDLSKYFSKFYAWDNHEKKPLELGFEKIIGDDYKNYIVIGDRMEMDLDVPSKMGCKAIFVNNKGINQNKYQEIDRIDKLMDIL